MRSPRWRAVPLTRFGRVRSCALPSVLMSCSGAVASYHLALFATTHTYTGRVGDENAFTATTAEVAALNNDGAAVMLVPVLRFVCLCVCVLLAAVLAVPS